MAYGTLRVGVAAAACLWAAAQPVGAQTFVETLVNTYTNNPQIEAERARQRSNDEDVARARGGWRPTVTFYGEGGRGRDEQRQRAANGTTLRNSFYRDPAQARIILQQNIYDGGRTIADVERSEQTVMRGREVLNATEQQALLDGINAHLDVYRDLQIRGFINDLVVALQRQQRGIMARRAVGDATTTDAAQAEARVARGISDRQFIDGNLEASRSAYQRVTGAPATENIEDAPYPTQLPLQLVDAERSVNDNPSLRAALYLERVAEADIDAAGSGLRPNLGLRASWNRYQQQDSPTLGRDVGEVALTLNMPLYEGGVAAARVREAKQIAAQRRMETEATRRQVIDQIRRTWEALASARARVESTQVQIRASEVAVRGLEQEVRVGTRTVSDLLNAEQDFLDARSGYIRAKRDAIGAAYQLLSAVGRLTVDELQIPVERYDPAAYYAKTNWRFFGTGIEQETPNTPVR
ncbi:MAG: TolC family outer membrane protein [Elsteraceae bacterium]